MASSILITGGAASGKTRFAITNFAAFDYVLYLRTGEELDKDITNRIDFSTRKHHVEWDIVHSRTLTPAEEVKDHKFVIFDSISAYTRHIVQEMWPNAEEAGEADKKQIEKRIIDEIADMRERVIDNHGCIMIITLETGFSADTADPARDLYRDILGSVNQRIANTCDEAYFSASGIQFKIR